MDGLVGWLVGRQSIGLTHEMSVSLSFLRWKLERCQLVWNQLFAFHSLTDRAHLLSWICFLNSLNLHLHSFLCVMMKRRDCFDQSKLIESSQLNEPIVMQDNVERGKMCWNQSQSRFTLSSDWLGIWREIFRHLSRIAGQIQMKNEVTFSQGQ